MRVTTDQRNDSAPSATGTVVVTRASRPCQVRKASRTTAIVEHFFSLFSWKKAIFEGLRTRHGRDARVTREFLSGTSEKVPKKTEIGSGYVHNIELARLAFTLLGVLIAVVFTSDVANAQTPAAAIAIQADTLYTMAGAAIKDGVVTIRDGKIESVGPAADTPIPAGAKVLRAKVATPGLIDAHTVLGLQGFRNEARDQDQLEKSAPFQPELKAVDAFNAREKLVEYVRGFGVTTIHTGPQAGELAPGQTMIIKTSAKTVDDGLLNPTAMLSITLGEDAISEEKGKSPGTRSKQIAMLRGEFLKAQEYDRKHSKPAAATQPSTGPTSKPDDAPPARDLRTEVLVRALHKDLPVLITAHRAQDILSALKLAKEFDLRLVLDGAAEAYLMIEPIRAAGIPVILHPTMYRSHGEAENLSFETAAKLHAAGVRVAIQSGFEDYVPKTRVVLFEAAIAAANGLTFEQALATITSDSARILGIDGRVGSLAVGKDADIALFDGDPFEYTTHCVGVVIDGKVASESTN